MSSYTFHCDVTQAFIDRKAREHLEDTLLLLIDNNATATAASTAATATTRPPITTNAILQKLNDILELSPSSIQLSNARGDTPLHVACNFATSASSLSCKSNNNNEQQRLRIIQYLLESHPASLERCNSHGQTPLDVAVMTAAPVFIIHYLKDQFLSRQFLKNKLTGVCSLRFVVCNSSSSGTATTTMTTAHDYVSNSSFVIGKGSHSNDSSSNSSAEQKTLNYHNNNNNTKYAAVAEVRHVVLDYLIENHPQMALQKGDEEGNTLLHLLCQQSGNKDYLQTVKYVHSLNPQALFQRNQQDESPLSLACQGPAARSRPQMQYLLEQVVELFSHSSSVYSSLSSSGAKFKTTKAAAAAAASSSSSTNISSKSVKATTAATMKFLQQQQLLVFKRDDTLLHLLCRNPQTSLEVIDYLLAANCEYDGDRRHRIVPITKMWLETSNYDLDTPLHTVCQQILSASSQSQPQQQLGCTNQIEILKRLIQLNPFALSKTNGYHDTPLHILCRCPSSSLPFEVLRYVIQAFPPALLYSYHVSRNLPYWSQLAHVSALRATTTLVAGLASPSASHNSSAAAAAAADEEIKLAFLKTATIEATLAMSEALDVCGVTTISKSNPVVAATATRGGEANSSSGDEENDHNDNNGDIDSGDESSSMYLNHPMDLIHYIEQQTSATSNNNDKHNKHANASSPDICWGSSVWIWMGRSRHLDLISTLYRMDQAGRPYFADDASNLQKGLPVLETAINNLTCLYLHLRENPILCAAAAAASGGARRKPPLLLQPPQPRLQCVTPNNKQRMLRLSIGGGGGGAQKKVALNSSTSLCSSSKAGDKRQQNATITRPKTPLLKWRKKMLSWL